MKTSGNGVISIRRMQRSDIDAVLAIGQSGLTYRDMAASDPDGPLTMSFVAEADNKVVGFILSRAHYLGIPIAEVCVIHALAVAPEYQGRGIGSQLISRLQGRCEAEDIHTMRTLVPQHNNELRKYMESLGFQHSTIMNFDKTCGGED
jgi:ribosomal protein S18 acetylase RimI-like enzyme